MANNDEWPPGHGVIAGMVDSQESRCPGCGLLKPVSDEGTYDGYYNTSPECWGVYTQVLGAEYSNVLLFGQVHQLTVDTYAVQHAGGIHPDKSVDVHLAGLHLVLERGFAPPSVPRQLQRLADSVDVWPHFAPPNGTGLPTVCDVALADSLENHVRTVREWAEVVWASWSRYHGEVAELVERHLGMA
jgi:hypothetical protein